MTEDERPIIVPTPTGAITPLLRTLIVICAVSASISGFCAFGLSLYSAANTHRAVANSVRDLRLLLAQQKFDHEQNQNGQVELKAVVRQVEQHLDNTIHMSIAQTAESTLKELGK